MIEVNSPIATRNIDGEGRGKIEIFSIDGLQVLYRINEPYNITKIRRATMMISGERLYVKIMNQRYYMDSFEMLEPVIKEIKDDRE